jgi:hypothetical protein
MLRETIDTPASVTWRQFGGIVWVCTAVGVLVGLPTYFASFWPHVPWQYLPIFFVAASLVAGVFAVVAAVFASIVLILIAKYAPLEPAAPSGTVVLGVIAGAFVGAVHPLTVLCLMWEGFGPGDGGALGGLRLLVIVVTSGAIAGGLVVHRYGPGADDRLLRSIDSR